MSQQKMMSTRLNGAMFFLEHDSSTVTAAMSIMAKVQRMVSTFLRAQSHGMASGMLSLRKFLCHFSRLCI